MVGIVFPELINDHIIPFLQQYSTPPINSTGKLDYNRALELITTIGSGDKLSRKEVLSRNVKDPNSHSAWGEAEIAVFQSKIDNYKKKASESNFDEELLKVIGKNSEPGFGQVVEEEDSHRWEWSKRRLFKAGTSTVCHLDDLEEEFQVKLELDH